MTGRRSRYIYAGVAVVLALVLGPAPLAWAHKHPTPTERAAPAVVWVEARAQVEVALIEHRPVGDPSGVHIGIIQSVWNPVLASASGFAVDPSGVVVTTGALGAADITRAEVYAVNQAFLKQYGSAAPLPADPYSRHHIGPAGDSTEERLQACYPGGQTNDAGGCVVRATWDFRVYPYVTSQARFGAFPAEVIGKPTPDVTVVRVRGATSMPTVDLGRSTSGAQALSALGFTGVPRPGNPLLALNTHLATVGGTALKTTGLTAEDLSDALRLGRLVPAGLTGGPVVAEQGQVIGLLVPPSGPASANPSAASPSDIASSTPTPATESATTAASPSASASASPSPGGTATLPPAATPRLVTAAAITAALRAASITPHRGPVDTSFEQAMHLFKNRGYAGSIPGFRNALALFPGHYLATQNLAIATKLRGSSVSQPGQLPGQAAADTSTSVSPWLVAGLVLLGLVLLGLVAWAVLRRRRAPGPSTPVAPAAAAPQGTPPAPAMATAGVAGAAAGSPRPGAASGAGPAGARPSGAAASRPLSGPGAPRPGAQPSGPVPPPTAPSPGSSPPAQAGPRPAPAGAAVGGRPPGASAVRPGGSGPVPSPSGPGPVRTPASGPAGPPSSASGPGRPPASAPATPGGGARTRNFCTTCGGRLTPGDRFCGWCGQPVA
ncbi:hypothetical protein [Oryzihumus sp.]